MKCNEIEWLIAAVIGFYAFFSFVDLLRCRLSHGVCVLCAASIWSGVACDLFVVFCVVFELSKWLATCVNLKWVHARLLTSCVLISPFDRQGKLNSSRPRENLRRWSEKNNSKNFFGATFFRSLNSIRNRWDGDKWRRCWNKTKQKKKILCNFSNYEFGFVETKSICKRNESEDNGKNVQTIFWEMNENVHKRCIKKLLICLFETRNCIVVLNAENGMKKAPNAMKTTENRPKTVFPRFVFIYSVIREQIRHSWSIFSFCSLLFASFMFILSFRLLYFLAKTIDDDGRSFEHFVFSFWFCIM